MAVVRIPELDRTIDDADEIRAFLAAQGIDYERAAARRARRGRRAGRRRARRLQRQIDELKAQGGYVTADVIDVFPDTPGLDAMLNSFNSEHWHDEDEVRFIIEGRGVFHIIRRASRCSRSKSRPAI